MARTRRKIKTPTEKLETLIRRNESAEGRALMDWCGLQIRYPDFGMLFHVPNGGLRDLVVAANLKREGVKPGVSDYIMLTARRGFTAFVLELKVRPNKPTSDQLTFLRSARAEGCFATWCYGWTRAADYLAWYTSGDRTTMTSARDAIPDWNQASRSSLGFEPLSSFESVEIHERTTDGHFVDI